MATPVAEAPMAEVPALPEKGRMVSEQAMYLVEISLYRNALAFGGTRNPTEIWAAMKYNLPQTNAYYRELEEKDEDVANCLDSLKMSVTSRQRSVQPANEDDSAAVDTKEFIEQQLQNVNFDETLDCILDAPGYGFSVQEMIYDVSEGQVSVTAVEDCPQELFLFGNRFRPQIGNLQYLDQPWASEGVEVPEAKFLTTTYRKRGRNRMGRPLLKDVFWASWFKRNAQRLWLKFAEKGPGTAVVRYNDAASESERQLAAQLAQAIVDLTAVGVPNTFQIETELLKVARSQSPAVYQNLYQALQYNIARRILGETLTSFGNEGGTGSRSMGDTHADTLDARSVGVAKAVMAVINQGFVRPLVLWNFGPDAPLPIYTIDVKKKDDLVKRLAVDAGLQRMGKKFNVGYIVETYGVPLAGDENVESPDDLLVPNITAPNMAITDKAQATFAELAADAQVRQEMAEFDQIFNRVKTEAERIYKQRVGEIARAVIPIERH